MYVGLMKKDDVCNWKLHNTKLWLYNFLHKFVALCKVYIQNAT